MTFDLRSESWIPFRRLSGAVEWGTPDLLVDAIASDPVVSVASVRPDFDAAVGEFLIGLLTAAYQLSSEEEWLEHWSSPPTGDQLHATLATLPDAFDLDGEGPRFFQDYSRNELADADLSPVQELLVEGKNHPLFVKPGKLNIISRSAAAMALLTIQSCSPAGGRGYRTSLRGGGPVTTLVDPRRTGIAGSTGTAASLWRFLWANVLTMEELPGGAAATTTHSSPHDIFPWLAPTRTSEGADRSTSPADASALQCFFGMPRRISLEFADSPGVCDLTGVHEERPVSGFRVKGYGVQYLGWQHPLTPHYQGRTANEWLPVHGQPAGIGWRDWYPLLYSAPHEKKEPAKVISVFNNRRADRVGSDYTLVAFAFDVTNAKVRSWIDTRLPGLAESDQDRLDSIAALVASFTDATEFAAYVLQRSVVAALYDGSEAPPGDHTHLKASLWDAVESGFFGIVRNLPRDVASAMQAMREEFHADLRRSAETIFDSSVDQSVVEPKALRRCVVARFELSMALAGKGKTGAKLFQKLGLPVEDSGTARTSTNKTLRS